MCTYLNHPIDNTLVLPYYIVQAQYYYIHAANYIDGKEFLKLTVQDIKDMIPAVGTKKIKRLVPQVGLRFYSVMLQL